MAIDIIYEDNDLIAVCKPFGIPSQKDKTNEKDISEILKQYFNNSNAYAGIINRLDRPVGGIMLIGKNKIITSKMSELIREKEIKKTYLAVACGDLKNDSHLSDYLLKNQRLNITRVVNKNMPNAKLAELDYKVLEKYNDDTYGKLMLTEINLITGRHHQIRAQFANISAPLWGDTKYNDFFARKRGFFQIALWSYKIEFKHPVNNKNISLELKPDNIFPFNVFKYLKIQ